MLHCRMPAGRAHLLMLPTLAATLAATVLLGGCQAPAARLGTLPTLPSRTAPAAAIPHRIPGPPLNTNRFHAPAQLAGLTANGSISKPDGQGWKQWRYRDADNLLKITLYALPGGWQSLSAKRIVSGHYGQLRQRKVNDIYHSRGQALNFVKERRFNLNGRSTVISEMLINAAGEAPLYEVLLLSIDDDHFIRLELASRKPDTARLAQLAKRALTAFRNANAPQQAPASP